MSEKFIIEIISPDKKILESDAKEVIIPAYEGEMGILKDHISLITFLRPGLIRILNNNETAFFVEEGTVEFNDNNLLILTTTARKLSEINKNSLDSLIEDAEKKIKNNSVSDKEKYLLNYKIETLKSIN